MPGAPVSRSTTAARSTSSSHRRRASQRSPSESWTPRNAAATGSASQEAVSAALSTVADGMSIATPTRVRSTASGSSPAARRAPAMRREWKRVASRGRSRAAARAAGSTSVVSGPGPTVERLRLAAVRVADLAGPAGRVGGRLSASSPAAVRNSARRAATSLSGAASKRATASWTGRSRRSASASSSDGTPRTAELIGQCGPRCVGGRDLLAQVVEDQALVRAEGDEQASCPDLADGAQGLQSGAPVAEPEPAVVGSVERERFGEHIATRRLRSVVVLDREGYGVADPARGVAESIVVDDQRAIPAAPVRVGEDVLDQPAAVGDHVVQPEVGRARVPLALAQERHDLGVEVVDQIPGSGSPRAVPAGTPSRTSR